MGKRDVLINLVKSDIDVIVRYILFYFVLFYSILYRLIDTMCIEISVTLLSS